MINPQNQRIVKIVEILEQTNLFTEDETVLMEDYLTGRHDDQALEKLAFRDLSVVPGELSAQIRNIGNELANRGRGEEAARLGRLLFALGQSTCYEMIPGLTNYALEKSNILLEEPEKKVAVQAARISMNEYQLSRYTLSGLIKAAGEDPEVIRKAMDYQRNKYDNGRLILLAVYFRMKYENVTLIEKERGKDGRSGGILAGMGKLLGRGEKEEEKVIEIDAEDAVLLKQYGDILTNSLRSLFGSQMPELEVRELVNAVDRDKVGPDILKKVSHNYTVQRFMLRILGGTAFINYNQSHRLKNVVKICLAAGGSTMLGLMETMDLRGVLGTQGGDYDEIFGADSRQLISWGAAKGRMDILRKQFRRSRDVFLSYMNSADFELYSRMNSVIRELDPELYNARKDKEIFRQQAKAVEAFVEIVDSSLGNVVRDYLRGDAGLETLYANEDKLQSTGRRWGGKHLNILKSYQEGYGHDEFSRRCDTFWMLFRGTNYNNLRDGDTVRADRVKQLFHDVNLEGLDLRHQVDGYSDIYDSYYLDKWKEAFQTVAKGVFREYLQTRHDEMVQAFQAAGSNGRSFGLLVLGEAAEENKQVILGFAQDSSKQVKETLLHILVKQEDWEEDILKLLSSKKAGERETAIRVLTGWDTGKYSPVLGEALEKEKNGKVKNLLETALHVSHEEGNGGGKAITREDLVKELHKGGKKRSLAWAYETPFSTVHRKSGDEAEEEYLQAIFLSYSSMSPCGVNASAVTLAEDLDQREFAVYANELFDKWMEAGAESKKRWVLYAAAIHGGDEIVRKLQHQIQEWPQAARGAIASEAVQALALSPRPQALLIVDGISRKFKFKQVKAAAGKALEFAAAQLHITTEELADRIVPDLGFNENMERIFDYGDRKFTVAITTALEIEVFDESGKKLKNLPSPGKRDDEIKAPAAYEEFKQMKKQMKTTVSSQKMRLEMALSTGRQWTIESWKNLFVKNPVMHQFATGLIWGIYEDRKLVSTFRYMEDGSFNTEDEDEFELPETGEGGGTGQGQAFVGIVHPLELEEESLKTWKEQLEDYEIKQPVEQLDRPVYHMTKEEEEQKSLERFGGCILNDLSLGGKLQGMGWYRGSVQDAGGFYCYYREDRELGLGVELHFSGSYVGGANEDVTVYEARFYSTGGIPTAVDSSASGGTVVTGGIRRGSYVYDEADDSNSCFLKEVPKRYFSEIVLQLTRATASSTERNADWKNQK